MTATQEPTVNGAPKRIQRRRTKGWKMPAGAIYVGRPTRWGNPFTPRRRIRHGVEFWTCEPRGTRLDLVAHHAREVDAVAECVEKFRAEASRPSWVERVAELRGHDLACWCPLLDADGNRVPCHADVLLELANR